ncbi:MAG TPA: hypothetical protein VG248_19630 [Caulobacteraceae bacterium]|nr:hypothetical protein [Caulobacteraceae bacterium]
MSTIRFALAAASLAAAIAAASTVPAAPRGSGDEAAATAFTQLCLATGGDPAGISTAAGHDWKTGSEAVEALPGFTVESKVSSTREVGGASLTLSAWHGAKGGIKADDCQIAATNATPAPVLEKLTAEFGVQPEPVPNAKDAMVYQFTGKPGAWQAVDSAGRDAAAGAAGLDRVTVSKRGSNVSIELLKLTK